MIAISLFEAAYVAEVIRGGLQALPRGQYEAAKSLGMGYWKMHIFVILPQALKLVIPGIANTFLALVKDTPLIFVVGLIPSEKIKKFLTLYYVVIYPIIAFILIYYLISGGAFGLEWVETGAWGGLSIIMKMPKWTFVKALFY